MIKTGKELAEACANVARNYKTLYIKGCFGSPMTAKNKERYKKNNVYNTRAARKKMIDAATADTFGFDCVCLIKGLLWGWSGNTAKTYGGASYKSNGVPDIGADSIIKVCNGISNDFSDIAVGELLWKSGHVGIYIGDGLAVECTPSWKNNVQITAVQNIGKKSGYNSRTWTKHGKLPYVTYEQIVEEPADPAEGDAVAIDPAKSKKASYNAVYQVNAKGKGLNLRAGASTSKAVVEVMAEGSKFRCYGYYTGSWLYGVSESGRHGFCSKNYLRKMG